MVSGAFHGSLRRCHVRQNCRLSAKLMRSGTYDRVRGVRSGFCGLLWWPYAHGSRGGVCEPGSKADRCVSSLRSPNVVIGYGAESPPGVYLEARSLDASCRAVKPIAVNFRIPCHISVKKRKRPRGWPVLGRPLIAIWPSGVRCATSKPVTKGIIFGAFFARCGAEMFQFCHQGPQIITKPKRVIKRA